VKQESKAKQESKEPQAFKESKAKQESKEPQAFRG
jgi:hypothetical protein